MLLNQLDFYNLTKPKELWLKKVKILQGKLDVKFDYQLNATLSEEWLAYYQYWVGALVVEGAMRADVQGEFEEHAEEERPPTHN